jgi:predicted alpha/beta superfamily hydrolase
MKQFFFLLFFGTAIFAQKTNEKINSTSLGVARDITISLPASYEKDIKKKYPLLVLLDGEYLFDPFYGALQYGAYWDDMPEIIIVAIHQNKKNERINDSACDENTDLPTTNSANFYEFIGAELLPYMEKKYRLAPFKIIAGQDITAGFMNFFLYKGVPLFNAFISLSPELAIDMEIKVPQKLAVLKNPIFYYQSTSDEDIKEIQDPVKTFDENMKLITNPAVSYKYDAFKNTSHYSQALYAIPSALNLIFEKYKPISPSEYTNKIAVLESDYTEYLREKYDYINKSLGLKIPLRVIDFKAIETVIMNKNAYHELEKLATLAAEYYPKSLLSDYEMGVMYEKNGDSKRAAKKYQEASQGQEIGDWTKSMMLEKYEDMKSLNIKKK